MAALSFVPVNDVRKVFQDLIQIFPDNESYNELISYFSATYIEGPAGRNPLFPIEVWNHFESAIKKTSKTTNYYEGFHNALNSIFHCSHPNVWLLFDGLKRDIGCHRLTLANLLSDHSEVKKR